MCFRLAELPKKKYFYPIVFLIMAVVSFFPPITQTPYVQEDTQVVIVELLKVALKPFEAFGFIFHLSTLALIGWMFINPRANTRPLYWYMGVDFILIALAQSFGSTEMFGKVIHTGGLITFTLLGMMWIYAAVKGRFEPIKVEKRKQNFFYLPLALLSFWAPYQVVNGSVVMDFNPELLFTSPDYGMAFCFTAPVFLYLLYILYPNVSIVLYRITAYAALLYALFNLSHWFNADTRWMGFLHVPLLVFSIAGLVQTRKRKTL
jgi:hypothetical protein